MEKRYYEEQEARSSKEDRAREKLYWAKDLDEKERVKILRRIVTTSGTELMEISRRQQYYYGIAGRIDELREWRQDDPALINLLALLAALEEHANWIARKNKKTVDLITQIKEEKRKAAFVRGRKGAVNKRLRILFYEIRDLREKDRYSWSMIAKYLYLKHRKALDGKKVSGDYIRRVYQRIEQEIADSAAQDAKNLEILDNLLESR